MSQLKGENRNTIEDEKTLGKKVVTDIIKNYSDLESSIVCQLDMCNRLHPGTSGSSREDIWLQLFEQIVPKKFVIEHSIFVIDSLNNVSTEIDLAIIDNSYTPYIFQYGRMKYVPIEAVAAVIECKSTGIDIHEELSEQEGESSDEKANSKKKSSDLTNWYNRIKNLKTSRESIVRLAAGMTVDGVTCSAGKKIYTSTQTSTRPIRIFCGYDTKVSKRGEKFEKLKTYFDFILLAKSEENKIEITVNEKMKNLQNWYMELNHYKNENDERVIQNEDLIYRKLEDLKVTQNGAPVSLLTFNLQLNQLLMLLNNPIFFPHYAYAKMFNRGTEGGRE